jgi:hypothetical protein
VPSANVEIAAPQRQKTPDEVGTAPARHSENSQQPADSNEQKVPLRVSVKRCADSCVFIAEFLINFHPQAARRSGTGIGGARTRDSFCATKRDKKRGRRIVNWVR